MPLPNRRHALGTLAALAAAWPGFARAETAAGPRVLDFDWHDAARGRAVPVRLHLPALAGPRRPVPLVVFSHGIGGTRQGYSYLGRHWAQQGFASLHLQHVGSDHQVWRGNPLAVVGRLQSAAQEAEALARVADLRFALDQVLAGELAPLLDRHRIVGAGHSYGANTVLLASGARVERAGRGVDLRDERLKAAVLISAPPFYGERSPEAILAPVTLPTLHVTCTDDVIRIPGYYSPAEDRIAVFDAVGSVHKTLAVYRGGSHSMFTDRSGAGGSALNAQVKAATQGLSLAFMRQVFDGDAEALPQWAERWDDLIARFVQRRAEGGPAAPAAPADQRAPLTTA
jgi:dienelactone hydrolase